VLRPFVLSWFPQSSSESATIVAAAGVSDSISGKIGTKSSKKKKKKKDAWDDDDWGGGEGAASAAEEGMSAPVMSVPIFDTEAGMMVDVELLSQAGPEFSSGAVPSLALASANHAPLTAGNPPTH
jgi:hypothetical protein